MMTDRITWSSFAVLLQKASPKSKVCEERKPRQNALNFSWPFEKGWKTWEEMSTEAIRTGGALKMLRKWEVSTTTSEIEVGRGPIELIQLYSALHLFTSFFILKHAFEAFWCQRRTKPSWWGQMEGKKMLLKVLRNRKTKKDSSDFCEYGALWCSMTL